MVHLDPPLDWSPACTLTPLCVAGYVTYKPSSSQQNLEFWTDLAWGKNSFWGLNMAGETHK